MLTRTDIIKVNKAMRKKHAAKHYGVYAYCNLIECAIRNIRKARQNYDIEPRHAQEYEACLDSEVKRLFYKNWN